MLSQTVCAGSAPIFFLSHHGHSVPVLPVNAGPREILPLTSLRFFAAGLVFFEHAQMLPGLEWLGTGSNWPGRTGVSFFFVLSGFILNYSYGEFDWIGKFGPTARNYYWGRVARIYPVHWLMFCLALPLGLKSNTARVNVANFPWLLTLTDKMLPGFGAGPQPVKAAWTLSVEAIFYVLLPLFLLVLAKRRHRLLISFFLLAGCTVATLLLTRLFPGLNWSGYAHLPEFLLGMVTFQAYRQLVVVRHANALLLGGIFLVWIGVLWYIRHPNPNVYLGYAPGSAMIILGATSPQGRTARFLSQPFLVLLGGASYAFYLIHDPLLRYSRVAFYSRRIVLSPMISVCTLTLVFFLCTILSIACYRFFETPTRLKLRSLFLHRAVPATMGTLESSARALK